MVMGLRIRSLKTPLGLNIITLPSSTPSSFFTALGDEGEEAEEAEGEERGVRYEGPGTTVVEEVKYDIGTPREFTYCEGWRGRREDGSSISRGVNLAFLEDVLGGGLRGWWERERSEGCRGTDRRD